LVFPKLTFFVFVFRYGLWQIFLLHPFFKPYRSIFWRYDRRLKAFLQDKKEELSFFFDYRYDRLARKFIRSIIFIFLIVLFLFLFSIIILHFVSNFFIWDMFNEWFIRFFFEIA
jgi:hypothetical protein